MTASSSARTQMTFQQVRAWSVLPPDVLAVFQQLPRERFVPPAWQRAAYTDMAIPLGDGQHMLAPTVVGRILQAVSAQRSDRVLEIGTGSGYLTACLALVAAQVQSLEIRPALARLAREHLAACGIGNAQVEEADAFAWQPTAPQFDVIVITGSMPIYDVRFESLLRPGGRLFAVAGSAPVMEAQLVRLTDSGQREVRSLFETELDPLDNSTGISRFVF